MKFGGHMHLGEKDILILVCRVILQYHIIDGSCEFMVRNLPRKYNILVSLGVISTVAVEIKCF